jgi:hypothetical protein
VPAKYVNNVRRESNALLQRDANVHIDIQKRYMEGERDGSYFISTFTVKPFGVLVMPMEGVGLLKYQNYLEDRGRGSQFEHLWT